MFQKFADYIYYLLPTPFKMLQKKINQWYIFCKVIGGWYDEVKADLLRAADETAIATCSDILLPYYGEERKLTQYKNEDNTTFRIRIAMADEIESMGGTRDGILLAAKTTGLQNVEYYWLPVLTGDYSRWAEFYLLIYDSLDEPKTDTDFEVLRKNVRDVKGSESKDNYRYICTAECDLQHEGSTKVLIEDDICFFDGAFCFDGGHEFQPGKSEEIIL